MIYLIVILLNMKTCKLEACDGLDDVGGGVGEDNRGGALDGDALQHGIHHATRSPPVCP